MSWASPWAARAREAALQGPWVCKGPVAPRRTTRGVARGLAPCSSADGRPEMPGLRRGVPHFSRRTGGASPAACPTPGSCGSGAAALWAPRPAAVPGSISLLSSGSSEKDDTKRRILPTSRFLSLLPRVSFGLSAAGAMTRALSWHLPGSQPSPPCAGLRAQRCPPVPQTRAPGCRGCRWPGAPGGHSRLRAHTCVPTCAPGRRAGPPIPGWRRRVSALERESREALGWGCCQFSTNL